MRTPIVKISDIATQVRGVSYGKEDASKLSKPGFVPVLRANNITDNGLLLKDLIFVPKKCVSTQQFVLQHDIVIAASSGSIDVVGKAAQAKEDLGGGFGAFCKVLRPNTKVHPHYFAHYFYTPTYRRLISSLAAGANINNLRNGHLDDLEIPLPTFAEQKRIAAILDTADALRTIRRQAISQLDVLARAIFLEMFGDPVKNPKGFKTKYLMDFYVDKKNGTKCGPFGSALKKDEYRNEGVPVWNMDNITLAGTFHDSPSLWISASKFNELPSYSVINGDVIISRAGTVGKMGVVRTKFPNSIISTNLIRVRFGADLLPEYFVSLMTYCKGKVGRLKTGPDGTFTHMNTGVLDDLLFPCPPVSLQQNFVARLTTIEALKATQRTALTQNDALFAALQHRAFRGEL